VYVYSRVTAFFSYGDLNKAYVCRPMIENEVRKNRVSSVHAEGVRRSHDDAPPHHVALIWLSFVLKTARQSV